MSITAADIQNQVFEHSKHGYDVEQVDEFLSRLEMEVGSFAEQLEAAGAKAAELEARIAELEAKCDDYEVRINEQKQDDSVISNAIISAQRSAEAIKKEARERGEKVYRDAEAKSRDILRDALSEKQRTLEEVDRLKDSRERFRNEYLQLLQTFLKQAEQVFPEAGGIAAAGAAATTGGHSAPAVPESPIEKTAEEFGETDDVDIEDLD